MPSAAELQALLVRPNESLSVEYKSWLPLTENASRATLAKAAIALANHGGGIIVLGMRPNVAEGGALESQSRPAAIRRYSQDEINSAITRFADPAFHCELAFADHPVTGTEHAFVLVPADMAVPVMTTRDCEGVLTRWRAYIRKPGPRSEEPQTGAEWRSLFDRCIRAGRADMLDAIRAIVQGQAGIAPSAEAVDALLEFVTTGRERWQALIASLPANDAARMPLGRYELSFKFGGVPPLPNLPALRNAMANAGSVRHTGWGPFVNLTREPFQPRPINGTIQTWLGAPEEDRWMRTPSHCDFWVADPGGKLVLIRGYEEDASNGVEAGTIFDVTLPTWRVGEAMLYAARLARHFGENPSILVRCHYFGLSGRRLGSIEPRRGVINRWVCADSEAVLETETTAAEIDDNLPEILHPLLSPLFERFSFFELSAELVRDETERMRAGRF